MELLALGILVGALITMGVNKLFNFRKSTSKDDVYERTLKEWQASFEDLESKQTDLNLISSHAYSYLLTFPNSRCQMPQVLF